MFVGYQFWAIGADFWLAKIKRYIKFVLEIQFRNKGTQRNESFHNINMASCIYGLL